MVLLLSGCNVFERVFHDTPFDGQIVPGPTVPVHGKLPADFPTGGTLKVNGIAVTYGALPDREWTVDVPQDAAYPVTEVRAVYTAPNQNKYLDVSGVVTKPSLPDTPSGYSPDGVGMRFTNAGLTGLGPVINNLAAGAFDVQSLLVGQAVNSSDADGTVTDAGLG